MYSCQVILTAGNEIQSFIKNSHEICIISYTFHQKKYSFLKKMIAKLLEYSKLFI